MTNGILLTQHNQEVAQWSPDPFPRERVGSGHETISIMPRDTSSVSYSACNSNLLNKKFVQARCWYNIVTYIVTISYYFMNTEKVFLILVTIVTVKKPDEARFSLFIGH